MEAKEAKSMTALVSAFARAWHSLNNEATIFNDSLARRLLADEEYTGIAKKMAEGIGFFHPGFTGTPQEALRRVVDDQLSPAPLGRAAFAEKTLHQAARLGATQYLILGAGYDTFAYRQPDWARKLEIFEIDHPATAKDKQARLKNAGLEIAANVHYIAADFCQATWFEALLASGSFSAGSISCCTMLGLTYYLPQAVLASIFTTLSGLLAAGSSLIFDYPDQNSYNEKAGQRAKKQALLANAAQEEMLACYSYDDMEGLLSTAGFLIYEHLTPEEMTDQYFAAYNKANPAHRMTAFDNINYCLAVKSGQ